MGNIALQTYLVLWDTLMNKNTWRSWDVSQWQLHLRTFNTAPQTVAVFCHMTSVNISWFML
jgi:hypothetical protein